MWRFFPDENLSCSLLLEDISHPPTAPMQVLPDGVGRIQARHENVVKFIESEGKLLQEKAVMASGPGE